jgi:hypothetical protein
VTQNITVEPASAPTFDSIPAGITISYEDAEDYVTQIGSLTYSNGETGPCAITGVAQPQITEDYNQSGGSIIVTWEVSTGCGYTLSHTMVVTVEPIISSTGEVFKNSIQIGPNPVSQGASIRILNESREFNYELLRCDGQNAITGRTVKGNIPAPNVPGVYFLCLVFGSEFQVHKIVVQ